MKTFLLTAMLGAGAMSLLASAAQAQDFPSGPITFVVPYPPGGQIDMMARLLQPGLEEALGTSVLIENRPGAGGSIGAASAFRAAPNGQTIVLATNAVMTLNTLLQDDLGYDPVADAAPVSLVSESVFVIAVKADSPYQTLQDLLNTDGTRLTYGSSGAPQQILGELVSRGGAGNWSYVAYPGVAQALTDVIGGHINIGISTISSVLPHVGDDGLRILANSNATRLDSLPDMPTISETVPDVVSNSWSGIFAPAGTPPEVVAALNAAIAATLEKPDVRDWFTTASETILASSPEEAAARVEREIAYWGEVIDTVDLQLN